MFPVNAGALSHTPPASGYTTTANDYDATNDYATRGGDLTGAADGKAGTISCWVRLDGGDGNNFYILYGATNVFALFRNGSNVFRLAGRNASNTLILNVLSNTTYTASSSWIHILASWNLATPEAYLYINNADDEAAGSTETDDTIDYTHSEWAVGATDSGTFKFDGCISELWFEDTFIDITQASNRAKFISGGKPVNLGADGSIPTGASPLIYAPDGDPSTNAGTGGNFTITGTLSGCSTSPSD